MRIATSSTVRVALKALRRSRAASTVLAVPVAPADALDAALLGCTTGATVIVVPPDGKKTTLLFAANANRIWNEADGLAIASAIRAAPSRSVLVVDFEIPGFLVKQAIAAACARDMPRS